MEISKDDLKDILLFQIKRRITLLYKNFISMVEDIGEDHEAMMVRLESKMPPEYSKILDDYDYFNEDKYKYLRKKILDLGNDAIREIEENMKQFKIGV